MVSYEFAYSHLRVRVGALLHAAPTKDFRRGAAAEEFSRTPHFQVGPAAFQMNIQAF